MKRFRAVLFDLDGTLVDSNDLHAEAWRQALTGKGYDVTFERVRPLVGMGGDKIVPQLTGLEKGSEEAERIARERTQLFVDRYARLAMPFPGARQLLVRLKNEGYELVLATSANEVERQALLEVLDADELFDHITGSEDADRTKPDPDIISAALKKAGVQADQAVMVGDTEYDIEAASRAGLVTIAFRCGGNPEEELQGAFALYDGPSDLLERLESSPLGDLPGRSAKRAAPEKSVRH